MKVASHAVQGDLRMLIGALIRSDAVFRTAMPGHEEEIGRWRFRLNESFHPNKKAPATTGAFRSLSGVNLLQRPEPVVHVLVDLVLGEAVALLQLAFEL